MKTYIFTLKNAKNIDKQTTRVVSEMQTIFVRQRIEADPVGNGEIGFMVDLPLDIYQDVMDIPNFNKVMRVETRS